MQSQRSTNATDHTVRSGASIAILNTNAPVLPITDFIKASGGAGGITLTLAGAVYPTANPAAPTMLFQVHHAMKADNAAGPVTFVDSGSALFNGQSSYVLNDQYQWAIFIWDGTGWNVIGN